ncbi:CPBP family intramembrane glutamic endopeptidase [Streptomyces antarcticus]|uniref:CPBP family intramembrane glutamic endopeptidase n=1 Tax=Streptomyces antarcticus TaxID=2996458 RepID=UPI00226DB640|nr:MULTISPECIES: CPBP family intramembrane glutamic endopeptidase [unclassified Streptomyces]MCY0940492.1 CPBP family intramembrane metalloprotease [Streptomyces sp. H34-AA3]MCZ4082389.1 CPBP family intramembrane metalloprotease [Streptomyces sp. H34-S5]
MRFPLLSAVSVSIGWHLVLFVVAFTLPSIGFAGPVVVNLAACTVPLAVVARLRWWRAPWLATVLPRRPWLLVPPFLVVGLEATRGVTGSAEVLAASALLMVSVGISEELYARGVMQEFLRALSPWRTALWIGLLFGLGHVLSGVVFGRSPEYIAFQVLHASVFGFLLAALRLHTVSIWPLALLHAVSNWINSNSPGELPVWWEALRLLALTGYGVALVRACTQERMALSPSLT